jgi:hypothetical protein
MKTNKKAILGMLAAMIMSLGVMGGINSTSHSESNLQQVSVGAGYMAGATEGGASGAWSAVSNITACTSSGMAIYGAASVVGTATNPVGWGYWAITGVIAL